MHSELEHDDIQTLVLKAYPKLEGAAFLLMQVRRASSARRWLEVFEKKHVTTGRTTPQRAAQIAFTCPGLHALGLDPEVLGGFSLPFRSGMSAESRRNILGDVGANDPGKWAWGGPGKIPHGILLVYGKSPKDADAFAEEIRAISPTTGWTFRDLPKPLVLRPPGATRQTRIKEHFGFDDGIGNPEIRGEREDARPDNQVRSGEIVLGYPDETGTIPPGPQVPPGGQGGAVLPNGSLGRSGSYLALRQLEQHPSRFWNFLLEAEDKSPDGAIRLASKMVGRWPNGAPLARWSEIEPQPVHGSDDDFLYAGDPKGHACPIGAHVRRVNPRDDIPLLDDPGASIRAVRRRRILRRGRTYGEAIKGWPNPVEMANHDDKPGRGLHFLCFCADIDRQFEFIQQSWVNSPKFAGLGNDADPLLSVPDFPEETPPSRFTIQREGVSRRVENLPQFVVVRGGAYFFMPGRRALRYLAGLEHAKGS